MPQRNPEVGDRDTGRLRRALEARGYLMARAYRNGQLLHAVYVDGKGEERDIIGVTTREALDRIEQLADITTARAAE